MTNISFVKVSGLGFLYLDFLMYAGKMGQSQGTLTKERN